MNPTKTSRSGGRRSVDDSFAARFERALAVQGYSLSGLRERLAARGHPVSLATLSYWRSGERRPERAASLEALAEAEAILRVEPGHFLQALGPSRRRVPLAPEATLDSLFGPPELVAALRSLGFEEVLPGLVEETVQATFDVDEHGRDRRLGTRICYRAAETGAQRFALYIANNEPDGLLPVYGAVAGCRLGRAVSDLENGVFVQEAFLDRPLRTGETAIVEYQIALPWSAPSDPAYAHHVVRRVKDLLIWVRFDPRKVPSLVEVFQRQAGGPEARSRMDVTDAASVHVRLTDFGPGSAGVRWEW